MLSGELNNAKLEDVCVPENGVQTGPFGSLLHKKDYVDSGTPIITVEHLDDNRISHIETPFVSDEDKERLSKYVMQEGDIVFSRVGSVDRRALVRKSEDGWLFSGRCLRVRVNQEIIDPVFLSHFFGMESFKAYVRSIAVGATMPSLNTKLLSDLPIYYPEYDIQLEIAEILETLDQKIHLNRQTNKTLEVMAQAIFKSWFVDFDPVRAKMEAASAGRDPNLAAMAAIAGISLEQDWDEIEAGLDQKLARMSEAQQEQLSRTAQLFPDELVESEIGEVPKGWGIKSLDKIADYLNGRAMQKYPPEDGKPTLPVLKISQLRKGDTEGADIATADIPERFKIRNGDMIFSWSGSLLIRLWAGGDAALNQHLFKVTSEEYDQWFYYHWTKHHLDNFIRIAESKAVTMGHIKRSHLKEAKCAIPDKELLEIGSQHINLLLQQSVKLNLESNQLAELRDTLLPKLISGEVGV